MSSVTVVSEKGKEFVLEKKAVARINPRNCANCGTCREVCPVEAIEENQRIICHGCAVCTDKPGISPQAMEELATSRSCTTACPLGISPQGYVNLTKAGKLEEAYKLVWEKNPLPSVCARICHHPCEEDCKRGILVDKPIAIRNLKRYLGEKAEYKPAKYPRLYDERIAVIGAGPAGLTAGHYLSMAGYEVTVFESSPEAGGMLKRGIPGFRLDRGVVDKEVANLEAAGLEIRRGYRINAYTLKEIQRDYDAIVVATGAPNSKELEIEGWRLAGVMTALDFMEHVNHNQNVRRHLGQVFKFAGGEAVIIGGGSVAMDAARAALRVGASKVTVVCLECGDEIPAHPWELEEAREEGIEILEGYSPSRFTTDLFPTLTGVECCKVTEFSKDAAGKIACKLDEEGTIRIKADWAVVAIGQGPDKFWRERKGANVFFAGDVVNNKCSVIDAMASGRKAALEADAGLRGRALKDPMENHALHLAPAIEKMFPYNRRKTSRPAIPTLPAASRVASFAEVEGGFNDEEAEREAMSCLNCGYEVVDPDKCIACGMCQKLCPKGDVITMEAIGEGGIR